MTIPLFVGFVVTLILALTSRRLIVLVIAVMFGLAAAVSLYQDQHEAQLGMPRARRRGRAVAEGLAMRLLIGNLSEQAINRY